MSKAPQQEESLFRASALSESVMVNTEMYEYNLQDTNKDLYSDYLIFSHDVPFFRDDQIELLDKPFLLSIITSPAVMAFFYLRKENSDKSIINQVMEARIRKIIQAAIEENCDCIVLGAFGCGAFRNDPNDVANLFKKVLVDEGYKDYFEKITFAIFSPGKENNPFPAFCNAFNIPIPTD